LEREQERRRKVERKERYRASSIGAEPRDIMANTTMASSLAKEAGDVSIVGSNRACSNGGD